MAEHNEFGNKAEDLAVDYLLEKGYQILVRNYRYLKAEIDIISEYNGVVVVIEVKARTTDAFIEPQEAVNKKKIKLLVSAADEFMKQNNRNQEVRFDIISVLPNGENEYNINHIENAFEAIDAN